MKNLVFVVCTILLISGRIYAQTVAITSLSGNVFCSGDSVDVSYSASGSYTNRNSFTIQLSDKTGSFDQYFYNLGSKRTTTSGTIRIGVPTLEASTQYRIRAISSEPYVVSPVYFSALSLGPKPSAGATVALSRFTGFFAVMVDDTVRFQNQSQSASTYFWEFGPDAIPATSVEKDPLVRFTRPGLKRASMIATSPNGCSSYWATDDGKSNDRPYVVVVSCFPSIPASSVVDSTAALDNHSVKDVWVVPGGVVGGYNGGANYYVEPGGTVKPNGDYNVYYLKAGAAYFSSFARGSAIVFEEGAGMQGLDREQLLKCSNLEFDYSDAPPYKINPASISQVEGSSISLYPNPVASKLTIQHKEIPLREIIIRNTLGAEQLFAKPEGLGMTLIDVSHLSDGLYFVDILTDQGIETHKIIVTR
jgi:hypothetical protein